LGRRAGEQEWRELGLQESTDPLHISGLVTEEPRLGSDDETVDGETDATVDLIGIERRGIARREVGVEWRVGRRELLDIERDLDARLVASHRSEEVVRRQIVVLMLGTQEDPGDKITAEPAIADHRIGGPRIAVDFEWPSIVTVRIHAASQSDSEAV